jgi:hypothetical protein
VISLLDSGSAGTHHHRPTSCWLFEAEFYDAELCDDTARVCDGPMVMGNECTDGSAQLDATMGNTRSNNTRSSAPRHTILTTGAFELSIVGALHLLSSPPFWALTECLSPTIGRDLPSNTFFDADRRSQGRGEDRCP